MLNVYSKLSIHTLICSLSLPSPLPLLSYIRCHVAVITSDRLPSLTNGEVDSDFRNAEDSREVVSFELQFNSEVFAGERANECVNGKLGVHI